jgi:hypothetical protein
MSGEFIAAVGPTVCPEVGDQLGIAELIATGDAAL